MGVEVSKGVFGSLADIMLLSVLVILGGIIGLLMYHSALSTQLTVNMDDVNTISASMNYGDYFENEYASAVINLSEQEAAYQLGSGGGGITWTRSNIPVSDVESELRTNIEESALPKIRQYWPEFTEGTPCTLEANYDSVSVDEDRMTLTGEGSYVECDDPQVKSRYGVNDRISAPRSTRFIELGATAHSLAVNTQQELPSESNTRQGSDTSACTDDPDESAVQEDAKDEAKNKVESSYSIQEAVDNTEMSSDFEVFRSDDTLSGDYSLVSEETEQCCESFTTDSDGNTVCENFEEEYSATFGYKPTRIEVDYGILNTANLLLTSDGVREQTFEFVYEHPLTP